MFVGAIAGEVSLLLLDEPTNHLDVKVRRGLRLLNSIHWGATVGQP
ncbi:hypothetical protein OK016_17395 [Vibrio chagasii]|nr:hypothetical protein [Vibrio chagasii]